MAEVFAGHAIGDHGFQKPVAIKRLLPELASDQVFVERLIQEAKLLVGMQHGNIVSVLDLARDGDDVFLVMEFVDGPSLRQLLKSRGQRGLSLGTATYIVQAAAAGLEFAHARPGGAIIHADISPSNLLLTTSGEVRVADFGIARREGGGYGVVEGKWAYMAPEQARGEPLTPRSDVFALGVVLYELICGAHPFGRQVTHEERDSEPMRVIPPRVVKPSIPHGIDAICMRALAHDPRDRYARMQQLIDAIVEERFANQWREGASDLAQAIREVVPSANAPQAPRTMVTDRPVTIMTRSLLRELTPLPPQARRASSPSTPYGEGTPPPVSTPSASVHVAYEAEYAAQTPVPQTPQPRIPDSGANTNNMLAEEIRRAAALMEIPAAFRNGDGVPMPAFRFANAQQPNQDLSQVVGGHTMTGSQHVAAIAVEPRSSLRWTLGILMAAAFIGVVAGLAIKMKNRETVAADNVVAQNDKTKPDPAQATQANTDLPNLPPAPAAATSAPTVANPPSDTRTPDTQDRANAAAAAGGAAPQDPPRPVDTAKPAGGKDNVTITDDKEPKAPEAGDTKDAKDPPTAPETAKDPKDGKEPKDTKDPKETRDPPVATNPTGKRPPRDTKAAPAAPKSAIKSDQPPGYARIHTEPWGYASAMGQRVDTMGGKLTLPPGKHTIYLECAECQPKKRKVVTVYIKPEMTQNVSIQWDEED